MDTVTDTDTIYNHEFELGEQVSLWKEIKEIACEQDFVGW